MSTYNDTSTVSPRLDSPHIGCALTSGLMMSACTLAGGIIARVIVSELRKARPGS
jgi:hypothetical protein